jgi:hypothetical protein
MAEKRVSVRLAAVGGRQVRAELESVGEAGARGFGRLSREMEAANALGLLKDVATEVWTRIGDGAWSIVLRMRAVGNRLKAAWFDTLATMQDRWARFLKTISGALFRIPGMDGLAMDIGLDAAFAGQAVDQLRKTADEFRFYAGNLGDQADILAGNITRPLESMTALRAVMKGAGEDGTEALDQAAEAADRVTEALDSAGQAGRAAGAANADGAEQAATGWAAVTATLADYASKARDIGADIGQSLVGAFRSAEDAVAEFVKSGKLDFRDLVTSLIADLARLAARRFILGPMASALGGILGGAGELLAGVFHAGGAIGGPAPSRMVPAMAFAGAPRMHSGGWAGLRPDEVPAILQRGERVLSRREAQSYGAGSGVTININTRDAESFRQSRTQIAADIARAVSLGRRGL